MMKIIVNARMLMIAKSKNNLKKVLNYKLSTSIKLQPHYNSP